MRLALALGLVTLLGCGGGTIDDRRMQVHAGQEYAGGLWFTETQDDAEHVETNLGTGVALSTSTNVIACYAHRNPPCARFQPVPVQDIEQWERSEQRPGTPAPPAAPEPPTAGN